MHKSQVLKRENSLVTLYLEQCYFLIVLSPSECHVVNHKRQSNQWQQMYIHWKTVSPRFCALNKKECFSSAAFKWTEKLLKSRVVLRIMSTLNFIYFRLVTDAFLKYSKKNEMMATSRLICLIHHLLFLAFQSLSHC